MMVPKGSKRLLGNAEGPVTKRVCARAFFVEKDVKSKRQHTSQKRSLTPAIRDQPPAKSAKRQITAVAKIDIDTKRQMGSLAASGKLSFLERKSVSMEGLQKYEFYVNQFRAFCLAHGLSTKPSARTDQYLADFFDICFLEERSANYGEKMVAGIEFLNTRFQDGTFSLIRSKRALRGWRKMIPPGSRLPLAELIVFGMAMEMVADGDRDMATKMLTD